MMREGDIVWCRITPERGVTKVRPMVIVQIRRADAIAVAVTTSPRNPNDPNLVALPFNRQSADTKLRRASWAVCNWVKAITKDDIENTNGHVSAEKVIEIVQKM